MENKPKQDPEKVIFNFSKVSLSGVEKSTSIDISVFVYRLHSSDYLINPFSANVPPLYPLKTSENLRLSDVFGGGYRSGTLVENGLTMNYLIEALIS